MKTVKSFYASNFALSIFLDSEGTLTGTFLIRGNCLVQHDFTGIYLTTDTQTEVVFSIDWETVEPAASESVFYGVINHEEETLSLNWLMAFSDGQSPAEASGPDEPIVLTRDHNTNVYVRNVPFPGIKIKEAEGINHLS